MGLFFSRRHLHGENNGLQQSVVCILYERTVLATKPSGSYFGPQWLSPLHCHGRCESIVFSSSFQTGKLLLNLISCRLHFNYSALKQATVECPLIQPFLGSSSFRSTFIAAPSTWPISAPKNTYQLRGMARTLRMRTTISPGEWQPLLGLINMA